MVLRMKDLVTRSGASARTIRRWIADGSFPAQKDKTGQYAFTEEDIERAMHRVNPNYRPISNYIMSLSNNKGGVGKTASCINLARELSQHYEVLLVDFDPQSNATAATVENPSQFSFLDHLQNNVPVEDLILPGQYFDVLPSHISFEQAEILYAEPVPEATLRLRNELKKLDKYNIIIIDTLPSLGVLQRMALCAADGVLVPVQAASFAIEGVYNLDMLIQDVNQEYDVDTHIIGIFITMFDQRVRMANLISEQLTDAFGKLRYETVIRRNSSIDEAMTLRVAVQDIAPRSFGALDYKALAWEVVRHVTQ